MSYDLLFAFICSLAGILAGAVWIKSILGRPAGNDRMREIAAAVHCPGSTGPSPSSVSCSLS